MCHTQKSSVPFERNRLHILRRQTKDSITEMLIFNFQVKKETTP